MLFKAILTLSVWGIDSVGFLFCIACIACKLVWCYALVQGLVTAIDLLHRQLFGFQHGKSSLVVQLFISLAFLLQLDHVTFRAACKHTQFY